MMVRTGFGVSFFSAAMVAFAELGVMFVSTTITSASLTMKTLLASNISPGGLRRIAAYTPSTTFWTSNSGVSDCELRGMIAARAATTTAKTRMALAT
jgi:hypothetical protein